MLESGREAIADRVRVALSDIQQAHRRSREDNPDFYADYREDLVLAELALERVLDTMTLHGLKGSKPKPKQARKGMHRLTCEACGKEFNARNERRRVCYDGCRVADIQ